MAFRDNEVSRVGEVRARAQAGDLAAMVDAAAALWLEPPERPDQPDSAAAEVWDAIVAARAVPRAVEAGRMHVLAGRKLRPHAFVDLVEHVDDAEHLLALATAVLDARWDAHPYLAAVFLRMIEAGLEDPLWAFIRAHHDRLAAATPSWIVVGYVLTTSRIGKREDIARWFERWEARDGVPSWLIQTYAAARAQIGATLPALAELARLARARCVPDATSTLFATLVMIDLAARDRHDELAAGMPELRAMLDAGARRSLLDHPLVRWANAVKHRAPIDQADLTYVPVDRRPSVTMAIAGARGEHARPPNWRVGLVARELEPMVTAAREILPLFVAMLEVPRGDPKAVELFEQMTRARPARLRAVVPAWNRLVKQRIPLVTRLRLMWG